MKRALLAAAFLISAQGAAAQNLVTNGDFSLGNVGFTSDYVYSPVTNNGGAEYTVRTDPFP